MGLADIDRALGIQSQPKSGLAAIDEALKTPSAPPADTRSTATRLFQDYVARPATSAVDIATRPLMNATADSLVPIARAINEGSLKPLLERDYAPAFAPNPAAKATAELVVPQTPLQAGVMAGTLGAGPALSAAGKVAPRALAALEAIPALGKLFTSPAAGRIAGGTLGGAVGGAAEDPSLIGAAKGAALGGATTGLGEGIGAGLPAAATGLKRINPFGGPATGAYARAQAAKDAQALGQVIGEISPTLAGKSTAAELQQMASGAGREALSAQQQAGIDKLSQNGMLDVPSLAKIAGNEAGDTMLSVQAAKDSLATLRKAAARNPLLSSEYRTANAELKQALEQAGGPQAVQDWETMQSGYRTGSALLDKVLGRSGVYRPVEGGMELNMPQLQAALQNPKTAQTLKARLGEDGYNKLVEAVFRGAGAEAGRDVPGHSAYLPWYARLAGSGVVGGLLGTHGGGPVGGTLGGAATLGAEHLASKQLGKIYPNVGASYVGVPKPSTEALPELLQKILDLAAQRMASGGA